MSSSPHDSDEMDLLAENAAEAGLAWTGPPRVTRTEVGVGDGRTISALVWGDGPAEVVLLHGGAQNAHTFDTVALALDRPLVALDLPGHGHSSWREDHDYTPSTMAVDVATAVETLAPEARVVVGMSLGGLTTLALSAHRPDLVRRVVLVDITPGVDREKSRAIVEFISGPERFAGYEEMVERTVRHHPGRSETSLRRGVLHNAKQLDDGAWTWRWDPVRQGSGGPATVAAGLWDAVDDVRVPLTLVRGAVSPVVDDADVAELLRRQPGARVLVVDGAGHSIQGDRPLPLAAIIAAEAGERP
jgi:pimeloyl-ACP methyl ester carboxylesterase